MSDELILETKLAKLDCVLDGDTDYPNLTLRVDGVPVAVLEYHTAANDIRLMAYETAEMDDDDPILLIYRKGDK